MKTLVFLDPAVLWALKTQLLQWNLEIIFLVLGNELWTWRTHNTSQGQFFIQSWWNKQLRTFYLWRTKDCYFYDVSDWYRFKTCDLTKKNTLLCYHWLNQTYFLQKIYNTISNFMFGCLCVHFLVVYILLKLLGGIFDPSLPLCKQFVWWSLLTCKSTY